MVKRLVGCQDSSHLIVVGRMDVLVNAVARELHLPRKGREGSGIFSRTSGRWRGEGVRCIIGTHLPGRDRTLIDLPCSSHPLPSRYLWELTTSRVATMPLSRAVLEPGYAAAIHGSQQPTVKFLEMWGID